jgi:CheY-like chemotaxis protein
MNTEAKTILIIDDEEAIVLLLETILSVYGYNSLSSLDPREGLKLAKKEKPDLIILDIAMPEMDGYEVCRALKNCEETKDTPILMVTALALIQDKKKGIESGANGFVFKPFDPELVIEEIEKLTS